MSPNQPQISLIDTLVVVVQLRSLLSLFSEEKVTFRRTLR